MLRPFALFNGSVPSRHIRSSAGFTITTCVFEFSVHTGCADIITVVAEQIDARAFSPAFPAIFPRFVQHAVWRYCAQLGVDVCNGNRIDDRIE
jgi:hypothetical protein